MTKTERVLGVAGAVIAIFAFVTGIQSLRPRRDAKIPPAAAAAPPGTLSSPTSAELQRPNTSIYLTGFRSIPDFIVGCHVLLSETKGQFLAKEYIYADDNDGQAVIYVDNRPVLLKKVYKISDSDAFSEYRNDDYAAILTIHENTIAERESAAIVGTLTVRHRSGRSVTIAIHGEIAC